MRQGGTLILDLHKACYDVHIISAWQDHVDVEVSNIAFSFAFVAFLILVITKI